MDFMILRPLIRRIRLGIGFLFVGLRFRYPFLSPAPRGANLGSRSGVRRQLRPLWTFTTDRRHARRTRKSAGFCSGARVMYAFGIFNPYGTLRTRIGVRCLDLIDNVESAVGFVFRKSRIADKEFNKERFILTCLCVLSFCR